MNAQSLGEIHNSSFTIHDLLTMPEELRRIIPVPQPEVEEIFAIYQATTEFHQEVQSREAFAHYCEWYCTTSEQHRQELQQMRGELNILSWFRRGKR